MIKYKNSHFEISTEVKNPKPGVSIIYWSYYNQINIYIHKEQFFNELIQNYAKHRNQS